MKRDEPTLAEEAEFILDAVLTLRGRLQEVGNSSVSHWLVQAEVALNTVRIRLEEQGA